MPGAAQAGLRELLRAMNSYYTNRLEREHTRPSEIVRFAIPRHALRFYFPALWPEAEQDQALLEQEQRAAAAASAAG